jgi:hypothetical protein
MGGKKNILAKYENMLEDLLEDDRAVPAEPSLSNLSPNGHQSSSDFISSWR